MSCTAQENFDELDLPVWELPHIAEHKASTTRKFRNWLRGCKDRIEFEAASFMLDLCSSLES